MKHVLVAIALILGLAASALAQDASAIAEVPSVAAMGAGQVQEISSAAAEGLLAQGVAAADRAAGEDGRLSTAVEIALLLTVLSLLPAVLITLTSFTRIVIVLSFVRRALSLNDLPPNPVIIGLALFLTMFVMAPVGSDLYAEAWEPYDDGRIPIEEATERAWGTMSAFLVQNTRAGEMRLFAELSGADEVIAMLEPAGASVGAGTVLAADGTFEAAENLEPKDLPLTVVVPAFILSEMKTAFQMGFLLFLPFLVIDLVVASVLLSMGMFMLPPAMISTPIKVLVFVLVDGWRLVTESVVTSFFQGVV